MGKWCERVFSSLSLKIPQFHHSFLRISSTEIALGNLDLSFDSSVKLNFCSDIFSIFYLFPVIPPLSNNNLGSVSAIVNFFTSCANWYSFCNRKSRLIKCKFYITFFGSYLCMLFRLDILKTPCLETFLW